MHPALTGKFQSAVFHITEKIPKLTLLCYSATSPVKFLDVFHCRSLLFSIAPCLHSTFFLK